MDIGKIKIYQSELAVDGLAQKIKANRSIAYTTQVFRKSSSANKALASAIDRLSYASVQDKDLEYVKSILVSTNWNKNDDVFMPENTWNARHTPSHKPDNLDHDEHQIVGHMVSTWAISDDGEILADDTPIEELPSLYHVVNSSVIYKLWEDEELIERTETLLAEIDRGEKFVSMECIFGGFDYAARQSNGQIKLIARNDDTSFLTKHLKAYGGEGIYDGKKIGRAVKEIIFCGKGYVDKPANERSIIFDSADFSYTFSSVQHTKTYPEVDVVTSKEDSKCKDNKDDDENKKTGEDKGNEPLNKDLGVESNNKNNIEGAFNMSEILQKQYDKIEARNQELEAELKKALKTVSEANTSELQSKLTKASEDLDVIKKDLQAKAEELKSAKEEIGATQKELEATKAEKDELQKRVEAAEVEQLKASRISKLVDGGIAKEEASTKVELFASLSDEQFNSVADELIKASKAYKEKEDKEDKEDKEKKDKAAKDKEEKDKKDKGKNKKDKDDDDDAEGSDKDGAEAAEKATIEEGNDVSLASAGDKEEEDKHIRLRKEIASLISRSKKDSKKEEKE